MNQGTKEHTRRPDTRLTIGLLANQLEVRYHIMVLRGASDAIRKQDANLVCFIGGGLHAPSEPERQRNVIYDLASTENLDALIVLSSAAGTFVSLEEMTSFCERYQPLPIVSIGLPLEGTISLLVDNQKGLRDAITHLIEVHDRRRIAFICGPEGHQEAELRYQAYVETLAQHNLRLDRNLIAPGDFTAPAGVEAVQLLLDRRKVRFDAIVAANDDMVISAMEALQARGVHVPDEVAVVGFDDVEETDFLIPPLTTVRQPLYELGQRAADTLLAQLAGREPPEQIILPTELVVRQSCGCPAQAVVQARVEQATVPGKTFEAVTAEQRALTLSEIAHIMGSPTSTPYEPLWEAFVAEVKGNLSGVFLIELDEAFRQTIAEGGDVTAWQQAISALRRHVLPYLVDGPALSRAEDLWQQARVMSGEVTQRVQIHGKLRARQQTNVLREIKETLIAAFNVAELANVIIQQLPRLGITACYLSLYENPQNPTEEARLILAYDENGRIQLQDGGHRFPSHLLVPQDLLPHHRRYTFIVEPLYFQKSQSGFIVFEADPREGPVYEALRAQLSSALRGALLVQQVAQHSQALEQANTALQRRALQLEISAEVSRTVTSILDTDQLFRQAVNLIRDRFGFYHAGIFLLDEPGEWAVLREATGDAGAQMKAQGHHLAVADTSMVGWTALHRQPRIALDVDQDAVRFAHPLLPDTRSEMTLPLTVANRLLGVLNVQSTQEAAFDQDDIRSLQSMADQIAIAIENARRVSDEAVLLEMTSPVYRASRRLTTATAPGEVADAIIASVAETVADGCTVVEFGFSADGEPEALLYLGVWRRDREPQFQPGLRLPISESPFPLDLVSTFWVVPDVEQDERLPRSARRVFRDTGARALVNIPLRAREKVIGQVVVLRTTPGAFPEPAVRLYEALSDQASVALERAQLLDETRQRAERERQARQAIDHIRRAVDVEQALQTAAQEVVQTMEVPHAVIELSVEASE